MPGGGVEATARYATYNGARYRIFSRSRAVRAVVGEFYWAVKKGESTTGHGLRRPAAHALERVGRSRVRVD